LAIGIELGVGGERHTLSEDFSALIAQGDIVAM
jgi:hypothetical protein